MNDMRHIINLVERKAYTIQSNGSMVNVNVDRSQPKIQIKNRDGDVFDLHGESEEALRDYISKKNGWEEFKPGEGEASKGGNEELDAIVAKYAKPGMKLDDIAKMEQEAGSDSKSRYVLAHAAKTLGLDGLYRSDGKTFIYLENGKPKGAANANLQQSQDLAEKGLLPQAIVDKVQKVADKNKERDPAKAEKFQKVADTAKGEQSKPEEEPAAAKDYTDKIKAAQEILARATQQAPAEESFRPRSFADQLLAQLDEQISGREAQELAAIMKELEEALPEITDDSQKQQIEALMRQYKEWQDGKDAVDDADSQDSGTPQVDTDSDSAIAAAIEDPALWIKNEMQKELDKFEAKGLLKATDNGKRKSASAAAVQKLMTQIGSVTQEPEFDIDTDGYYGPASVKAVKKAQELAGITVDGDPGAETAAELLKFSENPTGEGGMRDADLGKDLDRAIELLTTGIASFEGGSSEETPAPAPGGGQMSRGRRRQNASVDFRDLISIVEGALYEAMSPEEEEEFAKLRDGSIKAYLDDPQAADALPQELKDKLSKFTELRNQYNDLVTGAAEAAKKAMAEIPAEINDAVKGAGTDEKAVYDALAKVKDKAMWDQILKSDPDLLPRMLDDFGGAELDKVIGILKGKGIDVTVNTKSGMFSAGEYTYDGKKYKLEKARVGATDPANAQPPGGTANPNVPSGQPVQQNQSKDYGMKKAITESASMNISMSGDNAGEVGELLKILKNAGMEDAAPVGAVAMPMDTEMPAEPQGPMPCATCGGDHGEDTPCGGGSWDNSPDEDHGELGDIIKLSGGPNSNKNPGDIRIKDPSPYEDVEEDGWDNSPDAEYKDDDYMYQSGGIHKKKKAYKAAQDGDNAMAVESIKDRLYAELAAKTK